jgi:MFS-type transporter involved in bile tolerance (Atg22 family)
MTQENKTIFNSKKFIAFFVSIGIIAGVLVTALVTQSFTWPMVVFMSAGMLALAFLCISYVSTQGTLDKFVELMKGISGNVKKHLE